MYKFLDFQSREEVRTDSLVFTGKGRPWEVVMDLSEVRRRLNLEYFRKSPLFVSKYLPLLPVRDSSNFVSMGEGETPLIRSNVLEKEFSAQVYFKLEGQNPTGSFKDRGSAVELSVAREYGASGIVLASTGNMAASCACYAAAARIPCYVIVPEGTPQSKMAQVIAYGGRIVQVKGTYGDAARLAEEIAEQYGFYLAGDYAFRVEGGKTAAFELIEQMHYQLPDIVVVPIGCGTNLASYYKGFQEYVELGLISKIPHLLGVQAEAANPVVRAYKEGRKTFDPLGEVRSLARAIAINDPLDGIKALDAIYRSEGWAVDLTEEEMVRCQYDLSREEGIFVETSSAAALAALRRFTGKEKGKLVGEVPQKTSGILPDAAFLKGKTIVCILTGTGLKDPDPIIRSSLRPGSIIPSLDEFKTLLDKGLKDPPRLHFLGDLEFAFNASVSKSEVVEYIVKRLGIILENDSFDKIFDLVKQHLDRGIPVLTSDLKYIIEEVREEEDLSSPAFRVDSYSLTTSSDTSVSCSISIRELGKEESLQHFSASGVGVIDAIFNVFMNVVSDDFVSLEDFRVEVRNVPPQGYTSVYLSLGTEGKRVSARASSGDMIGSAVKCFERACNKILA